MVDKVTMETQFHPVPPRFDVARNGLGRRRLPNLVRLRMVLGVTWYYSKGVDKHLKNRWSETGFYREALDDT